MFEEAWFQSSLLDVDTPETVGALGTTVERVRLTDGAWVDLRRGWISGADELFARLMETVPWRAERRKMYERIVDVPRLLCFYADGEPLPDPLLTEARATLDHHYAPELGEPFTTAGLCLYRDGKDSVAWHGDTIGRGSSQTRWSRSSRSAHPAPWPCAPATAPHHPCATRSATVTYW